MKYQFCIRFIGIDVNSAATKAVADCNSILNKNGYKDHTLTVKDNASKGKYYLRLIRDLTLFFFAIRRKSIIVVQYPLLSINNVFKYFIKLARLKGAKLYCIIHDLESLRTGGTDLQAITREIENLNYFDCVITHNHEMTNWLTAHGLIIETVELGIFDYLAVEAGPDSATELVNSIGFAGNLSKSKFIYKLGAICKWKFEVFGPNLIRSEAAKNLNLQWCGEYSPELIVEKLNTAFGLIWDGNEIEKCDDALGNYLKYNNPHKFSLYIAAGLPVIAPYDAAIGKFIQQHNIGILINNLNDLDALVMDQHNYSKMKENLTAIRYDILNGRYFERAIAKAETFLLMSDE